MSFSDTFKMPVGVRSYFNIPYAPEVSATCRLDIFIPEGDRAMLLPAFVSIHGGHWKSGSKESQWALCSQLALEGWVAVAVDYRLSGEAPFPAAVTDLRHAIRFLREHSSEIGINRSCIIAEGHSAGGHLASLLGVLPERVVWDDDDAYYGVSSRCQGVVSIAGLKRNQILFLKHNNQSSKPWVKYVKNSKQIELGFMLLILM
ncbi:MAG: alpha/beta hydrolase, partial [Verrucomicrobiota bacterium]